ncbi:hypothetical protein [Bdellovibrio reynosensis]|uniref:Uncharacterized protein n=1 Tax=Bdellovibrio reynosensis TaxID=2835041 RepID=A0ABY4CAT0_9BACT|nr:hypothetical protein [Bdellovibrio reynosensis]UOF01574.1 hypothetical protein MNR06_01230 [Bdellovibrio reynosensis]
MLRAGRFRHRLLDDAFLNSKAELAHQCLKPFVALWQKRQLSDVEIASIYILIFCFLRRPQDFLGGPHNLISASKNHQAGVTGHAVIELLRHHLPKEYAQAKSLKRLDKPAPFVQLFCDFSWRSIPLSVQQSLIAWQSGNYVLNLTMGIPTPEEVLSMQAQGKRCISMLIQKNEVLNLVEEGRDVLGFIVHDLIHADHFFADAEKAVAQIEFSKKLMMVHKDAKIQEMLCEDKVFEKEFHYLMSDMNSVPLHLLKTLKAILLGYFKRRENISLKASLASQTEGEFLQFFRHILAPWDLSAEALSASERLNTVSYLGPLDDILLHKALL